MRAGNAVLAILVSAILARLLNQESLGYYFLIFAIVTICSNLVRGGMGVAAIRLIAEAEALGQMGRARQTVRLTLFGVLTIALLFSALYYLFLGDWLFTRFFNTQAIPGLTGLAAVWIFVVGLRTHVAHVFRGMHAVRLAATFNGFISTFFTLIFLMYLYTRESLPQLGEVVLCGIAGAAIGLLLSLALLQGRLRNFNGEGSIRFSEIGSTAWPLFLIGLTIMALTHGDMVLVGNLFDEADIALYGVALRLKGIFMLQVFAIGMVMSPLIARLYAQKENLKLERTMRLVSTIAIIPFTVIMLLLLFVGESLIALIFGEAYRGAYPILMIILGGLFVTAAMGSGQQLMMMSGHERMLLPIRLIGGLCAILGGLFAAHWGGILGFALAFSLSMAGVSVAIALTAKKLTGISSYVHSPRYFMNRQNRRALIQELRAVIHESMKRKRRKGRGAGDHN